MPNSQSDQHRSTSANRNSASQSPSKNLISRSQSKRKREASISESASGDDQDFKSHDNNHAQPSTSNGFSRQSKSSLDESDQLKPLHSPSNRSGKSRKTSKARDISGDHPTASTSHQSNNRSTSAGDSVSHLYNKVNGIGNHTDRAEAFLERKAQRERLERENNNRKSSDAQATSDLQHAPSVIKQLELTNQLSRNPNNSVSFKFGPSTRPSSSSSSASNHRSSSTLRGKGPSQTSSDVELENQLQIIPANAHASSNELETALLEISRLKKEVSFKEELIAAQRETIGKVHDEISCPVCMEVAWRPFVLHPCSHMFCVICLLAYFRKPLEDEAPLPEFADPVERIQAESAATLARKKLCPSCRVVVTVPPTEIWAVKSMTASVDRAQKLGMGSAESNGGYEALLDPEDEEGRAMRRRERGEDLPKGEQLWENIFRAKPRGAPIWDDDDHVHRCAVCTSEIERGICSNIGCGEIYSEMSDFGEDSEEENHLHQYGHGFIPAFSPSIDGGAGSDNENEIDVSSSEDGRGRGHLHLPVDQSDEEDDEELADFIVNDEGELPRRRLQLQFSEEEGDGTNSDESNPVRRRRTETLTGVDSSEEESIPRARGSRFNFRTSSDEDAHNRAVEEDARNRAGPSNPSRNQRSSRDHQRPRHQHTSRNQRSTFAVVSDSDDEVQQVAGPSRNGSRARPAMVSDSESDDEVRRALAPSRALPLRALVNSRARNASHGARLGVSSDEDQEDEPQRRYFFLPGRNRGGVDSSPVSSQEDRIVIRGSSEDEDDGDDGEDLRRGAVLSDSDEELHIHSEGEEGSGEDNQAIYSDE